MEYNFDKTERKWKEEWNKPQYNGRKLYEVVEDASKPKYYVLDMFPYPSGAGLHVGHPLGYVASDIYARYKRLKGFNVLHPMGYDAFGLPAEQYAIETGTHPAITTENAIKRYREQMDKIGFSFDWSREVKTCDPGYYKWTQWIFLKLFNSWYNRETNKAEPIETLIEKFKVQSIKLEVGGAEKEWDARSEIEKEKVLMNYRLAYQSYSEVNWCPALGTVLANDEVKEGKSERGGFPVERKKMRQWFLRITEYSDRLLDGLEKLDWSDAMKDMQRNWIGRSEGALVDFNISNPQSSIRNSQLQVFTTRPDTIFGATFMVIAAEHELVSSLTTAEQKEEVEKYLAYVKSRTDVERQAEKKVTGVFTGSYAVNPFTEKQIPIWIAEYVLSGYGTGAIMAVPADDERDKKFAEKFGLPIVEVIDKSMHPNAKMEDKVGVMINSGFLNGMEVNEAIKKIISEIETRGTGKRKVNYKQRDAGFSRQRYWGEPFPIKYNVVGQPDPPFDGESDDVPTPLNGGELPLILPEVSSYKPSGDGRAPLANNKDWTNKNYETDTMPGYAASSWYFLRYMDPKNESEFAAKEKINYWNSVDIYFGGAEHAVGHLLYARFWNMFLYDLGYVPFEEPFKKLVNQGMIQGVSAFMFEVVGTNKLVDATRVDFYKSHGKELMKKRVDIKFANEKSELQTDSFVAEKKEFAGYNFDSDGKPFLLHREVEKMGKSKLNVVNPDDVIAKYGADCFRMFEMFLGPIEQSKPWDDKGISGVSNFLKKFWKLYTPYISPLSLGEGQGLRTEEQPTGAEFKILHKTLKKIADDIERLNFNTSVSAFMIATNELTSLKCHKRKILEPLLIALAPFAPFITEELWSALGNKESIHLATYPTIEEKYLAESIHTYAVSINGKVRAEIILPLDVSQDEAKAQVMQMEKVQQWTKGAEPKKFIFVKGKIINVVV